MHRARVCYALADGLSEAGGAGVPRWGALLDATAPEALIEQGITTPQ